MKNLKFLLFALFLGTTLISCEQEEITKPEEKIEQSTQEKQNIVTEAQIFDTRNQIHWCNSSNKWHGTYIGNGEAFLKDGGQTVITAFKCPDSKRLCKWGNQTSKVKCSFGRTQKRVPGIRVVSN